MMKLYKIPLQKMAPVTNFQARGTKDQMSFRYSPSWSTHTIFLFHGLVSSSVYLSSLAHRLAERKIAQVVAVDLRGHGEDKRSLLWNKSHDIIQDFEEMLIHFKSKTAVERISFLGHSFGAKWVLKLLQDATPSLKVDQSFLVCPFLKEEQLKPGWFNKTPDQYPSQYKVSWPENIKTGKERFEYPLSFLDSFNLSEEEMKAVMKRSKFHLIEAGQDEILKPIGGLDFESVNTLPSATHMGIVMERQDVDAVCDLIEAKI